MKMNRRELMQNGVKLTLGVAVGNRLLVVENRWHSPQAQIIRRPQRPFPKVPVGSRHCGSPSRRQQYQ